MAQKFSSIFKTASHQRFEIRPRYYDPVKEDIERREAKLKKQLEAGVYDRIDVPDHIQGSFKRYSSKTNSMSTLIRLIILLLLMVAVLILLY